ncbi:ergothioneine biosynthesis glutamate--cysteine ligase EgtA [Allonocardiopsis opalescens]|uniref:ergothioneine biosynthesis glutamate--cysteine ligase EgtA n=1 Tax=Allonocardiopsis opalescens TaxID=1144618 RepID=UPI000D0527F6|nr:ergothioneine biosynthesis glutamate--cysteine ligase EgtA [Allonocardiopsis opalescens]
MAYLTEDDVLDHVRGVCFKTGPPGLVGIESEWLVIDPEHPHVPVPLRTVAPVVDAGGPPPAGSALTYEPGGQLELSSLPQPGLAAAFRAMATDLADLDGRLAAVGLCLSGHGLDPHRSVERQLAVPRYAAMEAYFDARGRAGRLMMCSTASVQICLDIGLDAEDARARWRRVHQLGPVLVAAFANSPLYRGRPTGWRSTRQAIWASCDPARTRPVRRGDPLSAWAEYVLDAPLMAIRREDAPWIVDPGLRFGEWLAGKLHGHPTRDDLEYHLTTLFPPVRPRGWLELRMVDALPRHWWPVPVAVATALLDDPAAARAADDCTAALAEAAGPEGGWRAAARHGPADPAIAEAARCCFAAARDALPRMGAHELIPVVDAYIELYVERGRCPADDLIHEERR